MSVEFVLKHSVDLECMTKLRLARDYAATITRLSLVLNPYVPAYLIMLTLDREGAFEVYYDSGTCIDVATEGREIAELVNEFNEYAHGIAPEFKRSVDPILNELINSVYEFNIAGTKAGLKSLIDLLSEYGFREEGSVIDGLSNELISRVRRGRRDDGLIRTARAVVEAVVKAVHKLTIRELGRKYLVLTDLGRGYSLVLLRAGSTGVHELPSDYYMQDMLITNLFPGSIKVSEEPSDDDVAMAQVLKSASKYAAPLLRVYLRARGFNPAGLENPEVGNILISNAHLVPALVKSLELGHAANITTGPKPALVEYMHVGIKSNNPGVDTLATLLIATTALRLIY